jgi:hypothetical protein
MGRRCWVSPSFSSLDWKWWNWEGRESGLILCSTTKKATRTTSVNSTTSKRSNSAGTGSKGPGGGAGIAKTFLSVEQQQVLQKVLADGQNIFFTGSAGKLHLPGSCNKANV